MIGIALSFVLISGATSPVDGQARARQFLEAFAANPVSAKQFATKDAVIVVGDIGGSYDDYVKVIKSKAPDWLKACQVGQLSEKPSPTTEELQDGPPRYLGGKISAFEGSYACVRKNNSRSDVKLTVVLKDDLVVDLYLGVGR